MLGSIMILCKLTIIILSVHLKLLVLFTLSKKTPKEVSRAGVNFNFEAWRSSRKTFGKSSMCKKLI
jgi:hypothetical protein